MRILFVSQLFDPEYSIKGLSLMRHWVEQGHEVEVVTTFPNYPTGRVFPGYKRMFKQVEEIDGVRVVRLWSHISHSKSKISRAASYLSFTFMAFMYALFAKKPDVLYAYHPQSTTGLLAVALKKLRGVPFVTDVQDLWPDALIATGLKRRGFAIRLIDNLCRVVYAQAAKVVVLSEGFKKALMDRGVPEGKINVIYNWCPEEARIAEIVVSSSYYINENKPAKLVYAGNIGAAQALKALIDAVGSFPPTTLVFDVYGNGVEKAELESYVYKVGYDNIVFKGYVPSSEIFSVLADADILAVHLRDEHLFKITIPSKTQSSMAVGKPILMAVGGEANEIVERSESGITAEPSSVLAIKAALSKFVNDKSRWKMMGKNSRQFYDNNFSTVANYQKLDTLLMEVVDANP
ncbi:glycosyltransferase family 4 protein [Halopseudomonas bauzanensis]|uniref:glycosyltransferase family 4 protein n=1 Tax=Halopseudomonas bauzanensis TaxID=653930 RepID=UPI003524F0C9